MIDRKCITSKVLCDVTSVGGCFQVADLPSISFRFLSVVLMAASAGNTSDKQKLVFFYAVFIINTRRTAVTLPKREGLNSRPSSSGE